MHGTDIARLLQIMAKLRHPDDGCPWDLAQTSASLTPYLLEEAHEVIDAIERGTPTDVCDELGDLLLQVVFHARLAEEAEQFAFADVVAAVCDKMERRHPHVFGSAEVADVDAQSRAWEQIKAAERAAAGTSAPASALDGVIRGLPALVRAVKLTRRAARVGFDWTSADGVLAKIDEELAELAAARTAGDQAALTEEYGDLVFAVANLGRHLAIDPETALRAASNKFERRFRAMERWLDDTADGIKAATPAEREAAWDRIKRQERDDGSPAASAR